MLYNVDIAEYYSRGTPEPNTFSGACFASQVEKPIKQLIDRYSLADKSILSLGAGDAFEEYWMYLAGTQLTLNDLDAANGKIEPYLQGLANGNLQYYIEDAADTIKIVDPHDVLYVSSFHPDELRREQIQAQHGGWPKEANPYSEILLDSTKSVKPGGLVIFQHYRGGVDLNENPHYIPAIIDSLGSRNITITDIYAYRKSTGHLLVVGCKGVPPEFGPEITEFHGRYPYKWISRDVIKVYDHKIGVTLPNPPGILKKLFIRMSEELKVMFYSRVSNLLIKKLNKY